MKNVIRFDDLVRVDTTPKYATLWIGQDSDNMQVQRRFPPGNDANVLCGAIQRALAEVVRRVTAGEPTGLDCEGNK